MISSVISFMCLVPCCEPLQNCEGLGFVSQAPNGRGCCCEANFPSCRAWFVLSPWAFLEDKPRPGEGKESGGERLYDRSGGQQGEEQARVTGSWAKPLARALRLCNQSRENRRRMRSDSRSEDLIRRLRERERGILEHGQTREPLPCALYRGQIENMRAESRCSALSWSQH